MEALKETDNDTTHTNKRSKKCIRELGKKTHPRHEPAHRLKNSAHGCRKKKHQNRLNPL